MRIFDIDDNERLRLVEGVQYGEKHRSSVLSRLDDFRIGLEAELVIPDVGDRLDYYDTAEEMIHSGATISDTPINSLFDTFDSYSPLAEVIDDYLSNHEAYIAHDSRLESLLNLLRTDNIDELFERFKNVTDDDEAIEATKEILNALYGGLSPSDVRNDLKPYYYMDDDYTVHNILDRLLNNNDSQANIYDLVVSMDSLNETVDEEDVIDDDGNVVDITSDQAERLSDSLDDVRIEIDKFIEERDSFIGFLETSSFNILVNYVEFFVETGGSFDTLYDEIDNVSSLEKDEFVADCARALNVDGRSLLDIDDLDVNSQSQDDGVASTEELIYDLGYEEYFYVTDEGDDMVEIISKDVGGNGIGGDDIEYAYNGLFEIIDELKKQGYTTRDSGDNQGSGLHVSISKTDYNGLTKPAKFLLLSNILELLPQDTRYIREYVFDIREKLMNRASFEILVSTLISNKIRNGTSLSQDYTKIIETWIERFIDSDQKYQTVNFGKMNTQKGRIEIRMFGGEGYESQQDMIWDETLRSMYALELADSETEGRKEYLKVINDLVNTVFKNYVEMDVSKYYVEIKKWYKFFDQFNPDFSKNIDLPNLTSFNYLNDVENQLYRSSQVLDRSKFAFYVDMLMFDGLSISEKDITPTFFNRNSDKVFPMNTVSGTLLPRKEPFNFIKKNLPKEIELWNNNVLVDGEVDQDELEIFRQVMEKR